MSSDCDRTKACIGNKCKDPCPGVCASTAICNVVNHIPMCSCPERMTGNAFVGCHPVLGKLVNFKMIKNCFYGGGIINMLSFQKPLLQIHASRRLAVLTASAEKLMDRQFVPVLRITWGLHHPAVLSAR